MLVGVACIGAIATASPPQVGDDTQVINSRLDSLQEHLGQRAEAVEQRVTRIEDRAFEVIVGCFAAMVLVGGAAYAMGLFLNRRWRRRLAAEHKTQVAEALDEVTQRVTGVIESAYECTMCLLQVAQIAVEASNAGGIDLTPALKRAALARAYMVLQCGDDREVGACASEVSRYCREASERARGRVALNRALGRPELGEMAREMLRMALEDLRNQDGNHAAGAAAAAG